MQREAEALSGAGFDVEVILGSGRPRRTVVNRVTVISLPADRHRGGSKARYALDYGRFFVFAAGILAVRHVRRPYHVVQVNSMPDFLVFAALTPKLLGSRVIAYMAEPTPELAETLFGPGFLTRILALIEQRALRFADHSETVTDQLKQRYVERGAAPDRITVVLNGADPGTMLRDELPTPAESKSGFIAVCHGTLEDRYGQDTIIEAARLLRDEMPDLRVVITGRGSLTEKIARVVADNRLQDVVRFDGWVSRARLMDILSSADVGIVAQKASPYSHLVHTNKMVDYWIFGLPVIASRLKAVSATYNDHVIEYFEPEMRSSWPQPSGGCALILAAERSSPGTASLPCSGTAGPFSVQPTSASITPSSGMSPLACLPVAPKLTTNIARSYENAGLMNAGQLSFRSRTGVLRSAGLLEGGLVPDPLA